jgi:hypothetical protein
LQGEVSTEDLIFGSIILAIFLVCVFAAGLVLNRVKNARFRRVWGPLIPVIGGRVVEDGGGAATSWLTGTYKGWQVSASMVPNRNRYPGETGFRYNYFDVALLETPGRSNWSLNDRPVSPDKALEQRLREASAMAVLDGTGPAEVIFDSKQRTLTFVQEMGPGWVPSPAQFVMQLDVLLRLAEINRAVNT